MFMPRNETHEDARRRVDLTKPCDRNALVVSRKFAILSAMSTLTIRIPEKLEADLKKAARRAGKSPTRLAREALEHAVQTPPPSADGALTLHERLRDLCGSVTGAPRDLGSNKKHLEGYGTCRR